MRSQMPVIPPVFDVIIDNGLRVVVSPDNAVPSVAVSLVYNVGSGHERPGQSGRAHAGEHAFFEGSRQVGPGEHARWVVSHGGVLNAFASEDVTVCFERVPAGCLDRVLWMEADRMATLSEGLTQARFDALRAAIAQERRLVFGRPYGTVRVRGAAALFPPGHPYHHTPFGVERDLEAATLEEIHGFYDRHYAPGDAVLTVVGDVTPDQVVAAADRYFGLIPARDRAPGPVTAVLEPMTVPVREDVTAPGTPHPAVECWFRLPPDSITTPDIDACDLALRILGRGPTSRLSRRTVDTDGTAQAVNAYTDRRRGTSVGVVAATAMPGTPAAALEEVLVQELERLAAKGPSDAEMGRCQAIAESEVLSGGPRMPGHIARAVSLGSFATAFGDAAAADTITDRLRAVTPDQVQQAAGRWLRPDARATITSHPDSAAASA